MNKVLWAGLGLVLSSQAQAVQNLSLFDHQRSHVTVSNHQLNRIAVRGDRIQQVFGADEQLHIETDEHGGQIFIKFLSPQSRSVSLTIITESGLTQDLTLDPSDVDAQTVLFKPGVQKEIFEEDTTHQEITELLRAMASGRTLAGYEISPVSTETGNGFVALKHYEGPRYIGIQFCFKNETDEPIELLEQELAQPGDLALSLSNNRVEPGASVYLYVVQAGKEKS